jgi:hypothetical protein
MFVEDEFEWNNTFLIQEYIWRHLLTPSATELPSTQQLLGYQERREGGNIFVNLSRASVTYPPVVHR